MIRHERHYNGLAAKFRNGDWDTAGVESGTAH
jgi:hypothetical protein